MYKFFKNSLYIGIAGIVLNIILFATNIYYEMVIPILENSKLEGSAFKFFDDMIFYTPCFFICLFLAYLIAGQIYIKRHHEKTEIKVTGEYTAQNAAIQKELDEKLEFVKKKYYTNCPKCGSARSEDEAECRFCGTSLVITKDEEDK